MFARKLFYFAIFTAILSLNLAAQNKLPRLLVAKDGRYLQDETGKPFFWLADTAWELFLKLNKEEAELYFDDRKSKGFNLIQITALSENDFHTIDAVNHYGHSPLVDGDPLRPDTIPGENNDYWDFVDTIMKLAESKGLYVGLLPTWGEYVTTEYRDGNVNSIFNAKNAFVYGKYIGNRYKDFTNIVWILGGDRSACTDEAKAVWRSLARGLAVGITGAEDYSKMLMTFHPVGKRHSTDDFPNEEWVDFNAIQSGHGDHILNWKMIQADYSTYSNKPVIDLESSYPFLSKESNSVVTNDFHARRAAYWSVFSGSFGHTYGHHGIWNFVENSDNKNINWKKAINAKSSSQVGYLKELIEAFSFSTRFPDQSIIASNPGLGIDHIAATRGEKFALVYTPINRPFVILMGKLEGRKVKARWFNPRDNNYQSIGILKNKGTLTFLPPTAGNPEYGNDWVLVLESYKQK